MHNQGLGANAPPTKHARLLASVDEVAALWRQLDAPGERLARAERPARAPEQA